MCHLGRICYSSLYRHFRHRFFFLSWPLCCSNTFPLVIHRYLGSKKKMTTMLKTIKATLPFLAKDPLHVKFMCFSMNNFRTLYWIQFLCGFTVYIQDRNLNIFISRRSAMDSIAFYILEMWCCINFNFKSFCTQTLHSVWIASTKII